STGSGKRRFPVLIKTDRTRMPLNPVKVSRFLQQGDKELTYLSAQFQGSTNKKRDRGRNDDNNRGGRNHASGKRSVHGAVVGSDAAELSSDNIGHRMLAKMGWTPGVGLGATGEGITQPIEAVIRDKRRGLGH
ncbi:G patch domain-containing protein 2, partial [Actinomortierella wolfii]